MAPANVESILASPGAPRVLAAVLGAVCGGGSRQVAAAEQVRTKVADALGPDGKQTPYAGAYVVNITR